MGQRLCHGCESGTEVGQGNQNKKENGSIARRCHLGEYFSNATNEATRGLGKLLGGAMHVENVADQGIPGNTDRHEVAVARRRRPLRGRVARGLLRREGWAVGHSQHDRSRLRVRIVVRQSPSDDRGRSVEGTRERPEPGRNITESPYGHIGL